MERALIETYEGGLEFIAEAQPRQSPLAIEIAALPETVRGFGQDGRRSSASSASGRSCSRNCSTRRRKRSRRKPPNEQPSRSRFRLGDELDMLRDTVRGFAESEIAPRAAEIDPTTVPARSVAEAGRARPARHHGRGGIRRRRPGLSRACGRDGGDQPRLGLGRPFLRRALQSLRQPDPPQRHARAEAPLSAEADHRRACRRAGHERAGRRLRCRLDEDCAPRSRATAMSSTAPRCGSPTARMPTCWWSMPRPIRRRLARHHRVPGREGLEGFLRRAEARQARHARLATPANWCSRIAKCRRRTCSARVGRRRRAC